LTWEGKAEALEALQDLPADWMLEEAIGAGPEAVRAELSLNSNRIIHGDALRIAQALELQGLAQQADVVYLDPPYASGVDYAHEDRGEGRVQRAVAYGDRWDDVACYLDMLLPRLAAARRLLKPTGSIWIQVDWRASYLVRSLCDELFGRERFLNEIVWRRAPNLGRQARSGQFGRTLDTIVVYGASTRTRLVPPERLATVSRRSARRDPESGRWFTVAPRGDYTDASMAKLDAEGRVHRSASGAMSVRYWLEEDAEGRLGRMRPLDALWIDIPPLRHAASEERTGYPTQKPRALLERIIAAAAPPGGLVIDLFAGSGTTGAAAAKLGRRFILGDASSVAIATMRSRLLRDGVTPLFIERCGEPKRAAGDHRARAKDAKNEGRAGSPDEGAAPLAATLDVRAAARDAMHVTLSCASHDSPVAWALSTSPRGAPFCVEWHAERATGKRGAEMLRTALIPRAPFVRARVYFLDGRVATPEASFSTASDSHPGAKWTSDGKGAETPPPAEPTSWFEAPT
jgi:DNA modification methylase